MTIKFIKLLNLTDFAADTTSCIVNSPKPRIMEKDCKLQFRKSTLIKKHRGTFFLAFKERNIQLLVREQNSYSISDHTGLVDKGNLHNTFRR